MQACSDIQRLAIYVTIYVRLRLDKYNVTQVLCSLISAQVTVQQVVLRTLVLSSSCEILLLLVRNYLGPDLDYVARHSAWRGYFSSYAMHTAWLDKHDIH